MSPKAKGRWLDIASLLLLAALTLVFFWKIALTNRILAGLDVFAYFYPYRDFASDALRSGTIPLWNPHLFMGAPFLANSQSAVLYPLHWPFIWLSTPKQVAWSIVLHIWLAAAGTFLLARHSFRLRRPAALTAAIIFGLGGFLGAQVEHLNQLNASAWLPWLLLSLDGAYSGRRWRWLPFLFGAAIVGLILLAGHTQSAYIVFTAAGLYAFFRELEGWRWLDWRQGIAGVATLVGMGAIGLLLAAAQLLPTLELSRLSIRSGGLPYREAASFSLDPRLVFKAFLPPLLWEPPFSEYVTYIGLIGLFLAVLGAWFVLKQKRRGSVALVLAVAGVFLALGAYNPIYFILFKVVPGISLFRAPARWLLLYGFGAALLAGMGMQGIVKVKRWQWVLTLLLVVELFVAGRRLAYNDPTSPAAFDSLRTAPAHLLADTVPAQVGSPGLEPFRFLSMSDITYDPGDSADLTAMYQDQLPPSAVYDLIVATKMKEVLAYNLPLRYRLHSVDGYDGGLLPIADYVALESLFLAEDEIWPDGRLRQQLRRVPPPRLLSMLNVKYIITDKARDVWIDDVYYDLEHTVPLGQVTLDNLPLFDSSHLGIVTYLTGTHDLPTGIPVGQVTITTTQGTTLTKQLLAGEHTAEGRYLPDHTAHRQAPIGHQWRDDESGHDYIAHVALGDPTTLAQIRIRSLLPDQALHLRGLSLIDEKSGTSRNASVHPAYSLVHSGDVKVYQNNQVLPRAFLVPKSTALDSEDAILDRMRDPDFDPGSEVVLFAQPGPESEGSTKDGGTSGVEITHYEPEEIQLSAYLEAPGYLVLTDTFYPGWLAEVDGLETPILRANLYFRALPLEAGSHQVTFRYQPTWQRWGAYLNLAGWLLLALAAIAATVSIGRKTLTGV